MATKKAATKKSSARTKMPVKDLPARSGATKVKGGSVSFGPEDLAGPSGRLQ